MREAKKIEGLRSALPSFPAALDGILPELDEPGLVGVRVQFEAPEPLLNCDQEALRGPLLLKTRHEIVGVTHDDRVAFDFAVALLLLEPEVKDIVQVDVR